MGLVAYRPHHLSESTLPHGQVGMDVSPTLDARWIVNRRRRRVNGLRSSRREDLEMGPVRHRPHLVFLP